MKDTINILGTGIGASLLVFLIIQVGFAQTLVDFVLDHISDDFTLSLIIFGLLSIAFIASIGTSILLTQFLSELSVLYASSLAYYASFISLIIISYIFMFLKFRSVFSMVHGFEIMLIFPQVIITFGLYVLGNIIVLFIISMVLYYLFFILFLDKFYIVKVQVK
ncbi:hypothetical protein LCGC14_1051670 [marine sediment metagenome]|uniref:Yip1 domain-containing protein n=1 Tax=marine sediment metagenome TaxID=412755 RepID=A0A0F9Q6U0_9ZZZZ